MFELEPNQDTDSDPIATDPGTAGEVVTAPAPPDLSAAIEAKKAEGRALAPLAAPPHGTVHATIHVPAAPRDKRVHHSRHINLLLKGPDVITFRRIYDGLHADRAKLPNGKYVSTPTDAIRWLIAEIGVALDE